MTAGHLSPSLCVGVLPAPASPARVQPVARCWPGWVGRAGGAVLFRWWIIRCILRCRRSAGIVGAGLVCVDSSPEVVGGFDRASVAAGC